MGKHKTFAFALVCLLAWTSASQGVVVCVGFDGHVALEPAAHTRCHHPVHAEEAEVGQFAKESSSHAESRHCRPCLDIPVSLGLPDGCSHPTKQQPGSHISSLSVNPDRTLEAVPILGAVSEAFYIPTPYFDPLRTVILLA